jgi:DNA-directed RNA polymerase specialized sigma24 family protein
MQRIPTSQPDPEIVYAEREALQFINEALGKMKPAIRQAFTMTYYDETSAPEARAPLGVSITAFKSRRLRARQQLFNYVKRIEVSRSHSTTTSFADKHPFQPLAARQPETGSLEVSLS